MPTSSTKKRDLVRECVVALCEAFDRRGSEPMIAAYRIGLQGISDRDVERAVAIALRTCKFMPKPAELRELAGAGETKVEDRAALAFAALEDAVRRHGYYRTVSFDDPAINATVRALGGWERMSDTRETQEWFSHFRHRFIQTYSAFARRGVSAEAGAPLIGYYDRVNKIEHPSAKPQPLQRIETGLPVTPLIGTERRAAIQEIEHIDGAILRLKKAD